MSAPEPTAPGPAGPAARRGMAFRKRRTGPLPTPDESRRQSEVVQAAWRRFGEPGPATAFLNTPHDALGGPPLRIAIDSDEGLERVKRLLDQMTPEA